MIRKDDSFLDEMMRKAQNAMAGASDIFSSKMLNIKSMEEEKKLADIHANINADFQIYCIDCNNAILEYTGIPLPQVKERLLNQGKDLVKRLQDYKKMRKILQEEQEAEIRQAEEQQRQQQDQKQNKDR